MFCVLFLCVVFFFKQKTAYEMRISDWSSDVCSSDLLPSIGGISGVEWDAVELPSQFMENFAWDRDALIGLSGHVDSGEPLPRAMFDRLLAARQFQAGLAILRQIELPTFDLLLHRHSDPAQLGRASCGERGGPEV